MDSDFGAEDEEPFFAWLPPEDRLWRHPSEDAARSRSAAGSPAGRPRLRAIRSWPESHLPGRAVWTVAVAAGAIGALAASGIGLAAGVYAHKTTIVRPVIASTSTVSVAPATDSAIDWTTVEDQVAPSVVTVQVTGPSGVQVGSGLLLFDAAGGGAYVVTDRGLVTSAMGTYASDAMEVTALSGTQSRATFVGQDPASGIALLSVPNTLPWIYASVGSVADLHQASPVIAMAAPSTGGGTVVAGTVNSADREVDVADGGDMENFVALSTPTMPASATGGPVVDRSGKVVGLTVRVNAVNAADQGLTFAAPIDEILTVARQMVANETVQHPWLGVTQTVDLPSAFARQKGISGGASVYAVATGSPAERAGISASDVIVSLDGAAVGSAGALAAILARSPTGQAVPIAFLHDDRLISTTVSLLPAPASG